MQLSSCLGVKGALVKVLWHKPLDSISRKLSQETRPQHRVHLLTVRSFGSRRWLGAAMAISMIEFRSAGEASGIGLLGLIKVKRKSRRRRGVRTLEDDQNRSDDAIDRRVKSPKVPQELLSVLKEMRRGLVCFWNIEHKRDAVKVVERGTRIQKSQLMLDLTAAMPREKSDQSLSLQPLQPVTKFVVRMHLDITCDEN
ncbi:hypothetical protein F2Q69_00046047 [Brassica cretica]|uniref:Uncharacterized protein n=1 Tax=Brassica cretica TaxID=69181 RepID=A0A8S9PVH9_BRACR|nr:hypothetical protein F2Q69_00046047 [Brassica cretica]